MLILTIILPARRLRCGTLTLAREDGAVLLDNVPIAAFASTWLAAQHGNPSRNTALAYGDPPEGTFEFQGIYESGDFTLLPALHYGPHGVLALRAVSGQALLAQAGGRGPLLIHGGPPGPHGRLRSTAGGMRVSNADMFALRHAIDSETRLHSLCITDQGEPGGALIYDDPKCAATDSLPAAAMQPAAKPRPVAMPTLSRRDIIRAAVAAPVVFAAAAPAAAYGQTAYDQPNVEPPPPAVAPGSAALQDLQNAGNTGNLFEGSDRPLATDAPINPSTDIPPTPPASPADQPDQPAQEELLPQVADDPAVDEQAQTVDTDDAQVTAAAAAYAAARVAWDAIKRRPDAPSDQMSTAFAALNRASGQLAFARSQARTAVTKLADDAEQAVRKQVKYVLDRNKPASD
jgi:hypothetical protein